MRVIFPQLRYIGDKVVLAAVGPEAVKSAESITSQNTIGAMRLAPVAQANGGTSGPDLTSAEVDVETGMVTYNFDEAIDRRISLDKIDAKNFRIISSAGDQHFGIAVAAIGPNWVSILFDKDMWRMLLPPPLRLPPSRTRKATATLSVRCSSSLPREEVQDAGGPAIAGPPAFLSQRGLLVSRKGRERGKRSPTCTGTRANLIKLSS